MLWIVLKCEEFCVVFLSCYMKKVELVVVCVICWCSGLVMWVSLFGVGGLVIRLVVILCVVVKKVEMVLGWSIVIVVIVLLFLRLIG